MLNLYKLISNKVEETMLFLISLADIIRNDKES